MLATKEAIIAPVWARERYIRSTMPVLWLPLYRKDFGATDYFTSADAYGHKCQSSGSIYGGIQGRFFDGTDDKIAIPHHAAMVFSPEVTVIGSFYAIGTGTAKVITKLTYSTGGFSCERRSNNIHCVLIGTAANEHVPSGIAWTVNQWHRIGWVIRGMTVNFFLDGRLVTTVVATTVSLLTCTADLLISGVAGELYNGYSDDIILVNRALSPAEMQRDFLAIRWRHQ